MGKLWEGRELGFRGHHGGIVVVLRGGLRVDALK